MSVEDKDDVEKIQPDEAGKIPADKEGKYPEVVPWHKYVGVKEKLGKERDKEKEAKEELQTKVSSLEEQLKKAITAEEHQKIKEELEETKGKLQTSSDELKGIKDKSVSELKETLKGKGIPEEKLAEMSEKELRVLVEAVGSIKPKPDLGGGGGSGELKGSPLQMATQAYEQSDKK